MIRRLTKFAPAAAIVITSFTGGTGALVIESHAASTGKTGLPLPRFVSIKSPRVNMRVGPGKQYKVDWLYQKKGLPLEIIQEYDNWRKVRDSEGHEGWILHSLLSGNRTALVAPWNTDEKSQTVNLFSGAVSNSAIIAMMQPGVLAEVQSCSNEECKVSVKGIEGYISKDDIWGVYPDEQIEE